MISVIPNVYPIQSVRPSQLSLPSYGDYPTMLYRPLAGPLEPYMYFALGGLVALLILKR